MTEKLSKLIARWAGGLGLTALFLLIHHYDEISLRDPDRYFHFAISRQIVESGQIVLRELPQIEGLGWDKFFAEKEFLFHQITALAYRIGGNDGVVQAAWLLALAGLLIFYNYAARRIGALASFFLTGIFFGSPILVWRLLMVRPHVLAIACFTAMIAFALKRNRWGLFFSILFFALSYHAFYMPLVVIGASFLAYYATRSGPEEKGEWTPYLFGLAGLACGILLNPYFPSNVVFGAQIALIPSLMSGKLSMIGFGDELYPVASNVFLTSFSIPLLIFLVAIWRMSRDHRHTGSFGYASLFLVQLMFFYLLITFQSRRGGEYLLPVAAFLAVEVWQSSGFSAEKATRRLFYGAAGLVFAWHVWAAVQEVRLDKWTGPSHVEGALKAAESLPPDRAALVFNCEWDFSPYLFYSRPKMRFLDILDPSLLYFANEEAHQARERLKASEVADSYGLLKNAFKADYVYCRNTVVVSQMERDPRFRRLFPESFEQKDASLGFFVYELKPEPLEGYVRNFEQVFVPAQDGDFRRIGPADIDFQGAKPEELTYSGFLDLSRQFSEQAKSAGDGGALCALVRPSRMKELAGSRYLSLGGGRNIRIWKNGKPWFSSEYAYLQAAMHQQIIPMGEALKESDRLDFLVCSAAKSNFWGLSLLGLTENQFGEICRWKRAYEKKQPALFDFSYGRRNQSCLGDVATGLVPVSLR